MAPPVSLVSHFNMVDKTDETKKLLKSSSIESQVLDMTFFSQFRLDLEQ